MEQTFHSELNLSSSLPLQTSPTRQICPLQPQPQPEAGAELNHLAGATFSVGQTFFPLLSVAPQCLFCPVMMLHNCALTHTLTHARVRVRVRVRVHSAPFQAYGRWLRV